MISFTAPDKKTFKGNSIFFSLACTFTSEDLVDDNGIEDFPIAVRQVTQLEDYDVISTYIDRLCE